MSRTINKVILVGNVGRDPDVYETKKGTKAVHLSLATNRLPFGDEAEQRTDWHRLTLWAGLAQFTEENVKKGDRIYVEGRLEYDAHEREGIRIPTADVSVRELVLLTAREAEVQVANWVSYWLLGAGPTTIPRSGAGRKRRTPSPLRRSGPALRRSARDPSPAAAPIRLSSSLHPCLGQASRRRRKELRG